VTKESKKMEQNEEQAQAARAAMTALFQEISELIADKTGLLMTVEQVEELWDEIQREELKRLVYQAFMAIQQDRMLAKKAASGEEPASSDEAK
jgi:hydroxymethylpyrimidine/phosphomethylpyrimidine kinase